MAFVKFKRPLVPSALVLRLPQLIGNESEPAVWTMYERLGKPWICTLKFPLVALGRAIRGISRLTKTFVVARLVIPWYENHVLRLTDVLLLTAPAVNRPLVMLKIGFVVPERNAAQLVWLN